MLTPDLSETMRVFVAVKISENEREDVGRLSRKLQNTKADVAWVDPENYHLTLKFFGNVDSGRLERIKGMLSGIAAGTKSFSARLSGVGAFPNLSRPSVIWIGLEQGGEEMSALARRINEAALAEGFAKEEHGHLIAHLTLGRVRDLSLSVELIQEIRKVRFDTKKAMTVDKMILYRSTPRPTGSLYDPLAEFSFGG